MDCNGLKKSDRVACSIKCHQYVRQMGFIGQDVTCIMKTQLQLVMFVCISMLEIHVGLGCPILFYFVQV